MTSSRRCCALKRAKTSLNNYESSDFLKWRFIICDVTTHMCSSRSFSARSFIILVLAAANMRHSSSSSCLNNNPMKLNIGPTISRFNHVTLLTSSCAFINSFIRFTSLRCFRLSANSCFASAAWISACKRHVTYHLHSPSKCDVSRDLGENSNGQTNHSLLFFDKLDWEFFQFFAFNLSFHPLLFVQLHVVPDSKHRKKSILRNDTKSYHSVWKGCMLDALCNLEPLCILVLLESLYSLILIFQYGLL